MNFKFFNILGKYIAAFEINSRFNNTELKVFLFAPQNAVLYSEYQVNFNLTKLQVLIFLSLEIIPLEFDLCLGLCFFCFFFAFIP